MLLNGLLLTGGIVYTSIQVYKHRQQAKKKKTPPPSFSQLVSQQSEKTDITTVENRADHNFSLATAGLGAAVSGIWLPPVGIISVTVLLYLTIPIFQRSYNGLAKKKRITNDFISMIVLPLMILSGYLLAAAFGYWLYYLGLKLLAKTKKRSEKQLTHIFHNQQRYVWIQKDGYEFEVSIDELQSSDSIVVHSGGIIPVDGIITDGMAVVDQRMMTGESQPAEKAPGDTVLACTIVLSGTLWIRAEKTGRETSAAHIEQILTHANEFAASTELRAEKISDRLALPTLALGALALPITGYTSALVILDSPLIDNLYITGTLSILSHLSAASRHKLLIKDGSVLERLRTVDTVVFDKTGTLTQDEPRVGKIYSCNGYTEETILIYAALAEHKQSHPVAKAVLRAIEEYQLDLPTYDDSRYELGYGIKVCMRGQTIQVGSLRFMELENIAVPADTAIIQKEVLQQGCSLLYVAVNNQLAGLIELRPCIRPEAETVIQELKKRGLSLSIISGDHEEPTKALARQLDIDHYFSETLPEDKADLIEQLQEQEKTVCFIGDGINDALALKKADVSISFNGASSIATNTAQIILMNDDLGKLTTLFSLSEKFEKNYRNSLLWDALPNAACIGGALFFHLGVYGSLAIYSAGLAGGVINGVLPFCPQGKEYKSLPGA
jgi:Cu2+-exporting ATPase